MKIIPVHHNKSRPVESWGQIKEIAERLRIYASNGPFEGPNFRACFALHHSQVEEQPYNFFVLSDSIPKGTEVKFPYWCIVNPEVMSGTMPFRPMEGCMSWPFRKEAKKDRFLVVLARFQYPKFNPLKFRTELVTVEAPLEKLTAHIFQHEADHGRGITIHG